MNCEADHRLSLASDDLSVLLMPGDTLQNDDQIADGHPGYTYLGSTPPQQQPPPSFAGQGHRLDEDGSDEDGSDEDCPYCPSMAHDWDGDVCKACGTTRERWDSAPP